MDKKILRLQGLSFREELDGEEIDFNNNLIYLSLVPWELCNWSCRYCHQDRRFTEEGDLTLMEIKGLIEEAGELRIRSLLLLGGEVILDRFWPVTSEVIKASAEASMITVIYTNAAEITEARAEFLAEHQVSVALKCDSLVPAKYDYLVGRKGAYRSFRRALEILERTAIGQTVEETEREKLVRLMLSTVGCRLNVGEYVSIARFATQHNARWMMESLNLHGNAIGNRQELEVDRQTHHRAMALTYVLNPQQHFDNGVSTNGCRLLAGVTIRKGGEIAICPQDYHFLDNIREVGSLKAAHELVKKRIGEEKLHQRWLSETKCPLKG